MIHVGEQGDYQVICAVIVPFADVKSLPGGLNWQLYVFRDVPAGVCQQCGEKYLTASVVKEIENLIHTRRQWDETIVVSVANFDSPAMAV